ncbi:MAG: MbnP family copper-binding protein [Cyanobacteria bacterium P01_C01_bin.72]
MLFSFAKKSQSLLLASTITLLMAGMSKAQSDIKEVSINFAAYVGESEFACGESYDGVGTEESTITPKDFRFYVSDLALIDDAGNAIPVELEQDGKWQYENTVLLDFEDGTGTCDNGTAAINTEVFGTVPEGDYQSLQFTLGVPEELNHNDAAIAPSPLNLTSMWWNWQGGYKFLRVDLETESAITTVSTSTEGQGILINQQSTRNSSTDGHHTHQTSRQASIFQNGKGTHSQTSSTHTSQAGSHDHHGGGSHKEHNHTSSNDYLIHLGSTGCSESTQSNLFSCANPNRVQVMLEDFDPEDDVVIADLGELLAQSDLSVNQANTPNGCMSSLEDSDCMPILQNLNLAETRVGESGQYFFFVE